MADAIISFLSPTNDLQIRLASCVLARHLFDRLNSGSIFSIFDETLTRLYRSFKTCRDNYLEDETLRAQAALAIEGLDDKVRESLTPSAKLEKKITVLG